MTKILLVEDDKSLREIYGVRLLAEGYDIVSAGDGEEALAMAIKEKPTLIISDVMMPKISGFDMLDILRSTTETRDIKVIMMTALSSDDQRTRGEQLGADRYLVKSQVGIEDVVRTVHEVLEDKAGVASAAPATPAPAVDTSAPAASPAVEPATSEPTTPPAADDTSTPTPEAASSESAETSGPGPLPPQPSESVLPQPTAPFSSPRPTNLGERVIHPLGDQDQDTPTEAIPADVSDQIAKELQASAEPVTSSQVDEAISDADVEPVLPSESAPAFDAPAPELPESPVTPDLPPIATPTPAPESIVSPSTPDNRPPTISGTSAPIS
jgi:CheY-like chemotaxis protein